MNPRTKTKPDGNIVEDETLDLKLMKIEKAVKRPK